VGIEIDKIANSKIIEKIDQTKRWFFKKDQYR
jgi:hypothetical protein